MAFVVPAEIGHAPYAAPLLEFLVRRFAVVHVVACRRKLFPELAGPHRVVRGEC
jgi:adenine-specific DNA-methyltransferase